MERHHDQLRLATILLLCLLNIGFGLYAWQMPMLIGGAAGVVYVLGAATRRLRPAPVRCD